MTRMLLSSLFSIVVAGCSCGTSHTPDGAQPGDTGGAEDAQLPIDAAAPMDAAPPMDAPRADTGACADDTREDDDTLAAGLAEDPIYALGGTTTITGLVACPGDDDYFHGYADCCGSPVGADLAWSAAQGTLELEILAPDGSPWPVDDVVTEGGHARRVETSSIAGHDFVVRVHNPGPQAVPYDLTVLALVIGP